MTSKKLLWKDELNPPVRCAFGNVFRFFILPTLIAFHISIFPFFYLSHFDCLSHFNYFRFFNINLSYIDSLLRNLLQKLQFKMRNIGVSCRIIGIVTVAFVLKYCGTAPHIGDCGYISASINIEVKNFEARYIWT